MSDLISRSALLQKFNDSGIQITFDLPVEEILGEDVDIDDFTMLVQDAIQAYKKMVIGTIKDMPTAYDIEKVVENINNIDTRRNWNSSCEECINHTTCKEIYNEEAKTKSNHLCSQVIKKLAIKEVRKGGME